MLNDEEACSSSSSATIEMSATEISFDLKTMQEKNPGISAEERALLKKKLLEEDTQMRKEKAIKAMNYLLEHCQKYSSLFSETLQNNDNTNTRNSLKNESQKVYNKNNNIDDEELLDIKIEENTKAEITSLPTPKYFIGNLYPYQHDGLSWLKLLYENSVNGLLADEMGLGKTVQIIALICALIENKIGGPYLIVAPLSTTSNWISEFKKFAPKIPVVLFHGTSEERQKMYPKINRIYMVDDFRTRPVVITSYQIPLMELRFLCNYRWQFLIIDEAQRLKNFECKLTKTLLKLNSLNRLLLTGTPLQNNLTELWTLLHFLMPQFFQNMGTFADLFQVEDFNESVKILKQEKDTNIIATIHGVLSPFMLRRLKTDVLEMVPKKEVLVYCPLSELQSDLYRFVLQNNSAQLFGHDSEEEENLEPRRKRRNSVETTSYLSSNGLQKNDPKRLEHNGDEENIKPERKRRSCVKTTSYLSPNSLKKNGPKRLEEHNNEGKENSRPERKRRKCVKTTSYLMPKVDDSFTENSPDVFPCDFSIKMPDVDEKAIYRKISMSNPMMIMRKIINHPFTVHCPVIPGSREIVVSEDIVTQSGKMMVLDAMLNKLKKRGHKVLVFSQFTCVLDFIEDYMIIRGHEYCRLDGNCSFLSRQNSIREFNTNPDKFVFLISTRAGGLGLNLTSADTVILFDRDWNPQNDLQAQDRCHRIGQKKPVVVYSLISKGTIDEYMLTRATAKRRLEKIVIQKGKFNNISNPKHVIKSANDLKELEELLNSVDHEQIIQPNGFVLSDEELEKILDRSDLI